VKFNPEIHHRRSIRLKGYDYTQPGAYFVTFCSYQRDEIFGEVINGKMKLSALGRLSAKNGCDRRKSARRFDYLMMNLCSCPIMDMELSGSWIPL